jgi:type 1 glutamine amidotransferase
MEVSAMEQNGGDEHRVSRKMMEDEYIQTVLDYCREIFSKPITENLRDYTPSYISKFIFNEHLKRIK